MASSIIQDKDQLMLFKVFLIMHCNGIPCLTLIYCSEPDLELRSWKVWPNFQVMLLFMHINNSGIFVGCLSFNST